MESIFSCFSSLYMSGNFLSEMEVIQKTPFSILQLTRSLAMIESLNTKAICLPVALSVSFAHLFILYLLICPLIVYFSEQSVSSLRKMKSLVVTIGSLEILSVCSDKMCYQPCSRYLFRLVREYGKKEKQTSIPKYFLLYSQ